jgi:hypothetical protein
MQKRSPQRHAGKGAFEISDLRFEIVSCDLKFEIVSCGLRFEI